MKAGVITVHKFANPSNPNYDKDFTGYILYMIRDEAVTTEATEHIALFNDYIYQKSSKTTLNHDKLFTSSKDALSYDEANELINCFDKAQSNKSCMWQTVISFENEWLQQNGLYDSSTGAVDVYKLRELTRKHMNVMLKNEELNDSAIWTASIHYNTEHTHIHIAVVEPFPTRSKTKDNEFKGKFQKQSIFKAKSAIVNDIINNSKESILINEIIRKNIIESKKENSLLLENDELYEKFLKLHELLPADKRLWKYNNNAMKDYRPMIDEITQMYIQKYHNNDYEKLEKMLMIRENNYKDAYGKADKFGSYKEKKIQDLYSRMGNTILKEIKDYDYQIKADFIKRTKICKHLLKDFRKFRNKKIIDFSVQRLINNLNDDYEHYKNQQQFEQLEWEANKDSQYDF